MNFTDEELENYFRLQRKAEEYLNNIIKNKRMIEYLKVENRICTNCHKEIPNCGKDWCGECGFPIGWEQLESQTDEETIKVSNVYNGGQ